MKIGGNQIGSGSELDLKPLFAQRNRMHTVWLSDGRETSRRKYADARRACSDGSQRCLVPTEGFGGCER